MIDDVWCIIDKCWASEYGYSWYIFIKQTRKNNILFKIRFMI